MKANVKQMSSKMLATCLSVSKRALAISLAMLMIMSCWVFVAPEQSVANAAGLSDYTATEIQAFETYVGATTGDATVDAAAQVTGKPYFSGDSDTNISNGNAANLYKNVIYSGSAKSVASISGGSIRSNDGAVESFHVFYPETVLMYDGVTNPQFGVSIRKDALKDMELHHWGTGISGTNLSLVNSNWRGVVDGSEAAKFLDAYYGGNENCGLNYSGTADNNNYYNGDAGGWYWHSNIIAYTTTSMSGYYTSVTPTFKTYLGLPANCDESAANKEFTLTSNTPIYILNVKIWNEAVASAMAMYKTISANENAYTAESVANFKTLAKALLDANPNKINWADGVSAGVSTYNTKASAAVTNWNNYSPVRAYTVKWVNYDGAVLETDSRVATGATPSYSGATPTRPTDEKYIYTFSGWSPNVSAVTADVTYTAQYSTEGNDGKLLFDNMFDLSEFNISTSHLTVNDITETGFTVTSTDGDDSNTGFSYAIPVEPGKTYVLSADVKIERAEADTKGFDIYINNLNADMTADTTAIVDTTNGANLEGDGYISLTGQKENLDNAYIRFTAGANTRYIKVRFDANTAGNKITVNNIRFRDESLVGDGVSFIPGMTVKYDNAYGNLPTPTRTAYAFAGWQLADGTAIDNNSIVKHAPSHTLYSKWTPVKYTITIDENGGNAAADKQYDIETGVMPAAATKANYDFVNWVVTSASGNWTAGDLYNANESIAGKYGNVTVKANWAPTAYKMQLDEDGGVAMPDASYTVESGVVPAGTTKTGYTFSHWVVVENAGNWVAGTKYYPGNALTGKYGDVALKAVYTANKYALTYDFNIPAGAVTAPECDTTSKTVTFDSAIGTLPVPTLDGYEFAGWYAEAECVTPVNAETVYTTASSSAIYAKWNVKTYNIITDENTGDDIADSTYTIENGTIPAGGTKNGKTFSHWEVAEDAGNWVAGTIYNAGDSTVGKYGDVTLKAIWTANKYTVSFDVNDADSASSATINKNQITVTYDSPLNVNEDMPVVSRNGYTFLGWFTAPEGGEKVEMSTVYTTNGDSTLYAQWEIIEYTLSFTINGGNAIDAIKYTVEDEIVLPAATREGYTFTNWRFLQATTGLWERNAYYEAGANLGAGFWGDISLTAMYTINTYTITWVVDGEVIATDSYNYNTIPQIANPEKAADSYYTYEFKSWSPAITKVTGDATYTAEFEAVPRKFTVSWVADGVTLDTIEIGYGEAIPATDAVVPEKTGHTGVWAAAPATMPANNVTIEAVYTPIKYAINWEVEGNVIRTDMVDYGTVPSYEGATPTKTADAEYSYEFKGWTPAISAVNGEATYVAEFTAIPNVYTITWKAEGSVVATTSVAFGSAITEIPEVPAKMGYVGSWTNVPETMPAENIEISAGYVKGSLVTWYLDGTADGAKYQLGFATGEQIEFDRSNPTKAADAEYTYTFSHWSETPGGAAISGYPAATDEDFTYYAVFSATPNVYTITWKLEDGTVVDTYEVAFGEALTAPSVPEKTGHNGVWVDAPATMPATDVTVYAEYTPINYTITWIIGDKTHITTFAYGTMPECTESTAKASSLTTDYSFAGWDKTVVTVTGNETYTATYTESARKYTVNWTYEDGTVFASFKVANGEPITEVPAIAEKEGHDVVYTLPDVMPTDNITIVVTYEAKSYTITWVTPSGNIEETWKFGETPVYDTEKYGVPVKESTPEKDFAFSTWSPSIGTVRGDATYTALFTETSRKYTVVWYVDGKFHETRDIAYGGIIPSLSIPEKEGYTAAWDTTYRTMPAKDLVINAVYTAKRYTVYWKVDGLTVYSASVAFGAAIPEQKVPDKLGCTGAWVDAPATMPAQNITINAEYTPKSYNVTWRFDGVTTTDTATYGVDFTVVFDGEERPEELKITVGGIAITEESYTYNAFDGSLTIKGSAIVGDVVIVARAAGGKCNLILNLFGGDSTTNVDVIPERQVFYTVLVPYEGYLLPIDVAVYVDGTYLTEGYTYDAATGKLIINAEVIYGEIEVFADFPVDPTYGTETPDVPSTNCGCNCHSDSAFIKFFFDIIIFLRKLFGMEQYRYCDCGAAHW